MAGQSRILQVTPGSVIRSVSGVNRKLANLGPLMTKLAADLERSVRRNFREGGRPRRWPQSRRMAYSGGKVLIDSGLLLNSIFRRNTGARATVFTRDLRAKIHEFGGTILPVKAKYLTIPIARESAGLRAKDFPDSFIVKSKAGNLIIMGRTLRDVYGNKKARPLFVLKKSVRMPARSYIVPPEEDLIGMGKRVQAYFSK